MTRAYNFSAGPAALPEPVLRQVQAELLEWKNERASVMEVSHRGQAFIDCAAEAERDLRELMAVPADYAVLFLQGGATVVQALLPLNLAGPDATADYVLTGHWGEKALDNARPVIRTRRCMSRCATRVDCWRSERSDWTRVMLALRSTAVSTTVMIATVMVSVIRSSINVKPASRRSACSRREFIVFPPLTPI